jgi:hypothetical protein
VGKNQQEVGATDNNPKEALIYSIFVFASEARQSSAFD